MRSCTAVPPLQPGCGKQSTHTRAYEVWRLGQGARGCTSQACSSWIRSCVPQLWSQGSHRHVPTLPNAAAANPGTWPKIVGVRSIKKALCQGLSKSSEVHSLWQVWAFGQRLLEEDPTKKPGGAPKTAKPKAKPAAAPKAKGKGGRGKVKGRGKGKLREVEEGEDPEESEECEEPEVEQEEVEPKSQKSMVVKKSPQ